MSERALKAVQQRSLLCYVYHFFLSPETLFLALMEKAAQIYLQLPKRQTQDVLPYLSQFINFWSIQYADSIKIEWLLV